MTPDERQFHAARISTPTAREIFAALAAASAPVTAAEVATVAQVSISATRDVLARAHKLNFVVQYATAGNAHHWALSTSGWDHLAALQSSYAPGSVNDVDASAIDHDDQPSSTTKTERTDRRGKPNWCTPGRGVCQQCKGS